MSFPIQVKAVTIAINTSLSSAAYIGDGDLVGIIMPAAWTTADLTFQAGVKLPAATPSLGETWTDSDPDPTYTNLFDNNAGEITCKAAVSQQYTLNQDFINGAQWLKIRSGTSGSAVTQLAARTIYIIVQKKAQYLPR